MFADAALPAGYAQRDGVLHEAALFNLAIALSDTVIDDGMAADLRALLRALHPTRLAARLEEPGARARLDIDIGAEPHTALPWRISWSHTEVHALYLPKPHSCGTYPVSGDERYRKE